MRKILILVVLGLVVAACGGAQSRDDDAPEESLSPVAGACSLDNPDCEDTPSSGEGDRPPLLVNDESQGGGSSGMLVDGGLTVGEALATDAEGVIAVQGFVFVDTDGARLCDLLAESLPPQCGGDTLPLAGLDGVDVSLLRESQGIRWTDNRVTLFGEIVDGVLVVDPMVQG